MKKIVTFCAFALLTALPAAHAQMKCRKLLVPLKSNTVTSEYLNYVATWRTYYGDIRMELAEKPFGAYVTLQCMNDSKSIEAREIRFQAIAQNKESGEKRAFLCVSRMKRGLAWRSTQWDEWRDLGTFCRENKYFEYDRNLSDENQRQSWSLDLSDPYRADYGPGGFYHPEYQPEFSGRPIDNDSGPDSHSSGDFGGGYSSGEPYPGIGGGSYDPYH